MGPPHSRQRYHDLALDTLLKAQDLQHKDKLGGPRAHSAVLAYIEGLILVELIIRACTALKVCGLGE